MRTWDNYVDKKKLWGQWWAYEGNENLLRTMRSLWGHCIEEFMRTIRTMRSIWGQWGAYEDNENNEEIIRLWRLKNKVLSYLFPPICCPNCPALSPICIMKHNLPLPWPCHLASPAFLRSTASRLPGQKQRGKTNVFLFMLMHRRGNNGVDEYRTCRELKLDSTAYNAIYEINYQNVLLTL